MLDSAPEKEFDDITILASLICNTSIALISLIDDSRQWFKSKVGISTTQTPRDFAFCTHAILQEGVFVVQDSSLDERFHDNPLVKGNPLAKFYAGVPLLAPESDLPIGTLCVIDTKARSLNHDQLKALQALARQVRRILELRVQNHKLQVANQSFIFQKSAFDNMSEGIILYSRSGTILDFNPMALVLLGLSSSQLTGKAPRDPKWKAIHEDGSPFTPADHPSLRALASGEHQKNVVMGVQVGNAKPSWLSINSVPLFLDESPSPSHAVTTFADVSEQKFYLQALFHSSTLASLGEMAGGIAHEINSPLTTICTATDLARSMLRQEPIPAEKIDALIAKIDSTAHRVAKIVKGLRTFARDSESDPWVSASLNEIVGDAMALCTEKFKAEGIPIHIQCEQDFIVSCVPTQLSQIVLNLLSNAHDAIQALPEKWIKIQSNCKENKISLSIIDSGTGIDTQIQEKIMQPFFTTKGVGKGTGLGLSISAGIAAKFNGKLFYEPTNRNTCFVLELPLDTDAATKSPA